MIPPVLARVALAAAAVFLLPGAGRPSCAAVPVTALAFSPDGGSLVSNGDRKLDLRSPTDAVIQRHLDLDLPKITCLAFSTDGALLAAGGGEPGVRGEVRLLTWPAGAGDRAIGDFGDFGDVVTCVAIDPAGRRLAVGSADRTVRLWRVGAEAASAPPLVLVGHAGPVLAVAFSPDGERVVTGSADRSLKVWSSADGRALRTLSRHTEAIQALAFRPGGAGPSVPVVCATGGDDQTVRVWQPEIGRMVRIVRGHRGAVLALAWSRDGRRLYSAGSEGIIRAIAGDSDAVEGEWRAHEDWIYALAISPDGTTLASGDWAGTVRIHDLRVRR